MVNLTLWQSRLIASLTTAASLTTTLQQRRLHG